MGHVVAVSDDVDDGDDGGGDSGDVMVVVVMVAITVKSGLLVLKGRHS